MSSIEEKLRRYEKIDFLGEGQFATVYKARDKENDGRYRIFLEISHCNVMYCNADNCIAAFLKRSVFVILSNLTFQKSHVMLTTAPLDVCLRKNIRVIIVIFLFEI